MFSILKIFRKNSNPQNKNSYSPENNNINSYRNLDVEECSILVKNIMIIQKYLSLLLTVYHNLSLNKIKTNNKIIENTNNSSINLLKFQIKIYEK